VRNLLKLKQPCKSKSQNAKKTTAACSKEPELATSPEVGSANSKTRTPGVTVSSATKLKLAAFSASDVRVLCSVYALLYFTGGVVVSTLVKAGVLHLTGSRL